MKKIKLLLLPIPILGIYLVAAVAISNGARATALQGSLYVPAPTPYRICDTRPGNSTPCSGIKRTSGSTLPLQVAGTAPLTGGTGVPTNATAAVLNVTATNTTGEGYFTVFPYSTQMPVISSVNWTQANTTVANLVQTPLNSGDISVYLYGASADLIIDVQGWYVPDTSSQGSLYYPLTPVRICDTRSGNSTPCAGKPLVGNQSYQVSIPTSLVPSNATAVVLNITVIDPSNYGFITVFPAGGSLPVVSNQNFSPGVIIPARVIATLSMSVPSTISLYLSAGTTDFAVDLNGYFVSTNTSTSGNEYFSLSPSRILDTRCQFRFSAAGCVSENLPGANAGLSMFGPGVNNQEIQAIGVDQVPSYATAISANLTIVSSSSYGYLSAYPAGASQPVISDINWTSSSQISANDAIISLGTSGTSAGLFSVYSYSQTDVIIDAFGFYAPAVTTSNPIIIVPSTLPEALVGQPYSVNLTAAGGSGPYTWTVSGLPTGLTACSNASYSCLISGTPTASASYNLNVSVTDSLSTVASLGVTLSVGVPNFGAPDKVGTAPVIMSSVSCVTSSFCAAGGALVSIYNGSGWSYPAEVDPQAGFNSLSCVTTSFCVGVDTSGQALTYNGSSWSKPVAIDSNSGYYGIMAVSCVTTTFCIAVDDNGNALLYNGSWQSPVMIDPAGSYMGHNFVSISCVTVSYCLAVDGVGNYFVYNGSWNYGGYIDPHFSSVSCPAVNWCLGVDTYGNVANFINGKWGSLNQIDPGYDLTSVSCSSTTFCMAVDVGGRAFIFQNGSWQGPWAVDGDKYGLHAVSCIYPAFCSAVSHTTIEYNNGTWQTPVINAGSQNAFMNISCPVIGWCMIATNSGEAIMLNGLTYSSPFEVEAGVQGFLGISCASEYYCVAVDNAGDVAIYNGGTWSVIPVDPGQSLTSVSCFSYGNCAAGDLSGRVLFQINGNWTSPVALAPQGSAIDAISCVSFAFCMAVDDSGHAYIFNGAGWTSYSIDSNLGPGDLTGVSCASSSFCMAVDFKDQAIIYQNGSFSGPQSVGPSFIGFSSVSCPAPGTCMAANWIGGVTFYSDGTFQPTYTIQPNQTGIPSISCAAPAYCGTGDDTSDAIITVSN
jgi:hypothetical protein